MGQRDPGLVPDASSHPQHTIPYGACLLNISSMCSFLSLFVGPAQVQTPPVPCLASPPNSSLIPALPFGTQNLLWLPEFLRRKPSSLPWPTCPSLMEHPFLLELSVSVILSPLRSLNPAYPLLCFIVYPITPPPGSPLGLSGWLGCTLGPPFSVLTLLHPHCHGSVSLTGL